MPGKRVQFDDETCWCSTSWRMIACTPSATVPFTCNSTPEPYDQIFLLR